MSSTTFALTGEIEGERRTYLLGGGVNRIGSRPGRGVTLAAPGVSKRHALIIVESEALAIEDLGSKNGTFKNGRRVTSAPLELGDELRFGAVTLRLQMARGVDGELAFTLPVATRDGRPYSRGSSTESQMVVPLEPGTRAMEVVEGFVERLPADANGDLGAALGALARFFAARGAALIERRGPARVLAAWGELPAMALAELGQSRHSDSRRRGGDESRCLEFASAELTLALWEAARGQDEPLGRIALRILERWLERCPQTPPAERKAGSLTFPAGHVPGQAPTMRALHRQLAAIADTDLPVLIVGETGTGKEAIAETLHASSSRSDGPLVAINCAAIPAELLEAELFGIGRGVATGVTERVGRFLQAAGGSLFLDEIGDMPAALQAKLLRALQEKWVHPLGQEPRSIDVRVIAATNARIETSLENGAFRRDLYYRLAGCVLHVPTLAERRSDIPALVEHFLSVARRTTGRAVRGISLAALEKLVTRPWPGNVRELEHEVQRLVLGCSDAQVIVSEMIEGSTGSGSRDILAGAVDSLDLESLERRAVEEALQSAAGNKAEAARRLGITRASLYRRLQRYGLGAV